MRRWRFEKRANALAEAIRRDPGLYLSGDWLERSLAELMDKAFEMGCEDASSANENIAKGIEIGMRIARPVISVTDLSGMPEILERIKDRWGTGNCH